MALQQLYVTYSKLLGTLTHAIQTLAKCLIHRPVSVRNTNWSHNMNQKQSNRDSANTISTCADELNDTVVSFASPPLHKPSDISPSLICVLSVCSLHSMTVLPSPSIVGFTLGFSYYNTSWKALDRTCTNILKKFPSFYLDFALGHNVQEARALCTAK